MGGKEGEDRVRREVSGSSSRFAAGIAPQRWVPTPGGGGLGTVGALAAGPAPPRSAGSFTSAPRSAGSFTSAPFPLAPPQRLAPVAPRGAAAGSSFMRSQVATANGVPHTPGPPAHLHAGSHHRASGHDPARQQVRPRRPHLLRDRRHTTQGPTAPRGLGHFALARRMFSSRLHIQGTRRRPKRAVGPRGWPTYVIPYRALTGYW